MKNLHLANRHRQIWINRPLLRRMLGHLLASRLQLQSYDLAFYFVAEPEMVQLNETFLHHAGSTDVISFDYSGPESDCQLHGEIFICTDEASTQARRFHTTLEKEITRYILHGLLHLCDYHDTTAAQKRRMKSREDQLLKNLAATFPLSQLTHHPRIPS